MADREQHHPAYPLAPAAANGIPQKDEESHDSHHHSKDLRRKKRMRCLLYIVIFAVFQIGIITLFALTIAKFRNPKFRVQSATFGNFDVSPATNNPSFNIAMNAELTVKNANFGNFKYQDTAVDFYYRDQKVGEGSVLRGKAKARDTRKFVVPVTLSSVNLTAREAGELGSDLRGGVLPVRSRSRLSGKVKIMVVLKKKRNANMDCTMEIVTATRELRNIVCR